MALQPNARSRQSHLTTRGQARWRPDSDALRMHKSVRAVPSGRARVRLPRACPSSSRKPHPNALSLVHSRTRRRILNARHAAPIRQHRQTFRRGLRQHRAHASCRGNSEPWARLPLAGLSSSSPSSRMLGWPRPMSAIARSPASSSAATGVLAGAWSGKSLGTSSTRSASSAPHETPAPRLARRSPPYRASHLASPPPPWPDWSAARSP